MLRPGRGARGIAVAAILWLHAASAEAVLVYADDVAADPGATVGISVSLDAQGDVVAGVQNDLRVDPPLRLGVRPNGRPACSVNPEIDKGGTSFAFQDELPFEHHTLRALVLALDNVDPIPDGSVLYTCSVHVDEPLFGSHPVRLFNPGASDPSGNALPTETRDGSVSGDVVAERAFIEIGNGSTCGPPSGGFHVTFVSGPALDSLVHDVGFDAAVRVGADDRGQPRCAAVPPLAAASATFAFVPEGCTPGHDCEGVHARLRGAGILPRATLYRCEVEVAPAAEPGSYPLRCENAFAGNVGIPSLVAVCRDGSYDVASCVPTPTPTPEELEAPTATPPPTRTQTPTVDAVPRASGGDDGCSVTGGGTGAEVLAGWLLLWSAARKRRWIGAPRERR